MLWFRNNYLPNADQEMLKKWDVSPFFAPDDLLRKVPPAWIGVAELDILREEGEKYGERLKENGVPVEIVVYKGAPHPIMAMDGQYVMSLSESFRLILSICECTLSMNDNCYRVSI